MHINQREDTSGAFNLTPMADKCPLRKALAVNSPSTLFMKDYKRPVVSNII